MRPDLEAHKTRVPLNADPRYRGSPVMGRLHTAGQRGLVNEGFVMTKELSIRGSGWPIWPGECAITSLVTGEERLFGATSGRRAHVFAYWPNPAGEAVLDLVALEEHTAIRHALAWVPGCGLFAGTSAPGRADYPGGELLKIAQVPLGDVIQEWGGARAKIESLGRPVDGEGVACMIGDPTRGRLYGLSDRTGTLFSVHAASGKIETHGPIDELHRFSPDLILGPDGFVYGCGTAGRLLRFDTEQKTVVDSGMSLPCMAGRGQYSAIGAWVLDEKSGLIYAGDVADGLLSVLDVCRGEVRVLGKPTAQPHIRALAVAPDGRVYGIAGLRDTICHLFVYTPCIGELRDLGVMTSATERRWYGYEFDCAAAGPDGRIYFGESDRISHLFVYFPPLLPATGTQASQWVAPAKVGPTGSQL